MITPRDQMAITQATSLLESAKWEVQTINVCADSIQIVATHKREDLNAPGGMAATGNR